MTEPTSLQLRATYAQALEASQRLSHLAGALKLLQDDVCLTQQPVQGETIDQWACVLEWLNKIVAAEQGHLAEALTVTLGQPVRIVR